MFYGSRPSSKPSVGTPGEAVADAAGDSEPAHVTETGNHPPQENFSANESTENNTSTKRRPALNASVVNTVAVQRDTNSTVERFVESKMTVESKDDIISMKVERLQELSTKNDRASMESILAEIRSPYQEVRADAIEAIIQFRSREAIPALKDIAAQTEDAAEKTAILEAVEFLELPTLDEFRANLREINRQKADAQSAPSK